MKQKRAISAVVATTLIIFITVAAIGIIWTAVMPTIKEGLEDEGMQGELSVITIGGYTIYDPENEIIQVQVKRGNDDKNYSGILIILHFEEGDAGSMRVDAPEKNSVKVYSFNVTERGIPERISISPIILKGQQEIVREITSNVWVPKRKIVDVPGPEDDLVDWDDGGDSRCDEAVDSDCDGCPDAEEIFFFGSLWIANPGSDTDGDGCTDCDEISKYLTDPKNKDSDSDSYEDCDEINQGSDPNDPDSPPTP